MKRAKKKPLKADAVVQLVSVLREGGLELKEIESYLRSEELRNLLNGAADEISDEISQREEIGDEASEYLAELLAALHVDPKTYALCSGPFLSAGVAANEAFSRARRSNQQLDKALAARDEKARRSLNEAFSLSKGKLRPDQDRERLLLRDSYQEIAKYWPVLMLLPNGPYEQGLRALLEELETGAGTGTLSTDDAALYDIAHTLVDAICSSGRGNEFS